MVSAPVAAGHRRSTHALQADGARGSVASRSDGPEQLAVGSGKPDEQLHCASKVLDFNDGTEANPLSFEVSTDRAAMRYH
jgi:hypothetical protein